MDTVQQPIADDAVLVERLKAGMSSDRVSRIVWAVAGEPDAVAVRPKPR